MIQHSEEQQKPPKKCFSGLISTSDDPDAYVQVCDGAAEGSRHHGHAAHEASRDDHGPAAVTVHQHTAHWT